MQSMIYVRAELAGYSQARQDLGYRVTKAGLQVLANQDLDKFVRATDWQDLDDVLPGGTYFTLAEVVKHEGPICVETAGHTGNTIVFEYDGTKVTFR